AGTDINVTNTVGNLTATSVSAGGNVILTNTTGTLTATLVTATGNVTLTDGGDIAVTSEEAGAAKTATLTANNNGSITGGTITAGTATLTAANSIATRTVVGTLNAAAGTGSVSITHTLPTRRASDPAGTYITVANTVGNLTATSVSAGGNVIL